MPNYEFMQVPGIDMLFNTKEERDQFGNVLIVKEVSSVANQLGKERVCPRHTEHRAGSLILLTKKR